jgi:hypothetical protein
MRIESPLLYIVWLVTLSCIVSTISGQETSEFDYQTLEPYFIRNISENHGDKRIHSLEYSPYGMEVRLILKTNWTVFGELLYVDDNAIYLALRNGEMKTYQFSEIHFIRGRFGRIAPRTFLLQSLGTITTIAAGFMALFTIPINLIIATSSDLMTKHALQFKSTNPQKDWLLLRSYSRYPAGLQNEQQAPPVHIQF